MAFSSRYRKASHGEDLRTRTSQGDGNYSFPFLIAILAILFKNQNPARGRKHALSERVIGLVMII